MEVPNDLEQAEARDELVRRLRAMDQSEQAIEEAEREGRLTTFAIEVALGGDRRHSLSAVSRQSGLSRDFLRRLLQANGRPIAAPRQRAYTDDDVELARRIKLLIDAGIPREGVLETARVTGQALSQIAESVRRTTVSPLLQPDDTDMTLALRYVQTADALSPEVAAVLDLIFRAQLRDGIRSDLVAEAERDTGKQSGTHEIAVAFADLVGYTKLGESVPTERLGEIATRLAELTTAALHRPTQIVKTIGDAVMLVSPEVDPMLETIQALVAAAEAEGEGFPALRVGVAFGAATPRAGDWFGSTVNLASRATDVGKGGRIYATPAVVERADGSYQWRRSRKRNLKGVDGRVRLYALLPPDAAGSDSPSESAE
ncbi:MAG: adenylate/guanylate cyclase domain-containing protein [Solirubrobacterales bacterium]|nr:adenylate/guanylate cyclase domain-containing protein [Solirubrobacterales bacterium]